MWRVPARASIRASGRLLSRYGYDKRQFSSSPDDDVLMHVSPNDDVSKIDTKGFFKYSWGRWLVNDDHEQAIRETKFSIKGLTDILKDKVDYLSKSPSNAELQIKAISPFHEGKHHKIYKIDLADGRSYALRIPYAIGLPEYRKARMQSEIATMDFLRRKHDVLMPGVISWSPTTDNRLGCEYVLLDFVKGDLLMKHWVPSSLDLKAKSATVKPAADFFEQIAHTKFNKFGGLYFTEDVASQYQNDLPYEAEQDKDLVDRYRIGPTVESRFWKGRTAAISESFRGPWASMKDYLADTANVQIAYAKDMLAQGQGDKQELQKTLDTFERYAKAATVLFEPEQEQLDPEIVAPRLHHPDLNPINIIHRTDPSMSYLLDLENTSIRPFLLHGAPGFVKHRGPKIFKKEDIPDYDTLSDLDKRAVDHFIAQTQNQFAFEFLFKQAQPALFSAFTPSIKRRQELVQTALHCSVGTKDYIDLDYDVVRLAQEWQFLGVVRPFPVEYSQEQLDAYVQDMDSWSKHVIDNPFLETKGWIPIHIFEKLVGEGLLVRQENGDFKLTKPFSV
jgi:hypothetical protein